MNIKLSIVFLSVVLMTSAASAINSYNWDINAVADWDDADGTNWVDELGNPVAKPDGRYEIKIRNPGSVVNLDTVEGNWNYTGSGTRLRVYERATLNITDGGELTGFGWIRVGDVSGVNGQIGTLNQSGGIILLKKLKDSGKLCIGDGAGIAPGSTYTMTGGILAYDAENAACAGQLVIGARDGEGTFVVAGDAPVIHMKNLYVAGDSGYNNSTGTLKFMVGSTGVSPINLDSTAYIDQGSDTTANLIVSLTGAPLISKDILLVNANTTIHGVFDSLNGGSAVEGAPVKLSFGDVNYGYTLTYAGGDNGNGIAMLWVPEPATVILIGFGLLFVTKRR